MLLANNQEIRQMQRTLQKARAEKQWEVVRRTCNELAAYYSQYDKFEDAIELYEESLSVSEKMGREMEVAIAKRMIGEMYCNLGKYEEALSYAQDYLNRAKRLGDKIEEQRGYATKGRIYVCWAEYLTSLRRRRNKDKIDGVLRSSLHAFEKSLDICERELHDVETKERLKMKSGLLQNLGLVMGLMKKFKDAATYLSAAIQINKKENFRENLFRCYLNQGEMYIRSNDVQSAFAFIDLATEISSSKEDVKECLKAKAKAHFLTGNFSEAKNTLRKLYKQQPRRDPSVEKQLRIAVHLCKLEKKLVSVPESDSKTRKRLYESQGDACCAVKNFEKGIEAYLNMLRCAEEAGEKNEDLVPCYTSLSQTYKDNKEYDMALKYCEMELSITENFGTPLEASKTYLYLGGLYTLLEYDYETVCSAYERALQLAQESGDRDQKIVVLKKIIRLQRDFGHVTLAESNVAKLTSLKADVVVESDTEGDSDASTEMPDLDLDDDELLSDREADEPRKRSKRTAFKVKRNLKGETELHVAAIGGNYGKVRQLIEKGHPVNEPDAAGWTALHEACNYGHLDVVEVLLSNGADVNNPGGKECGGITPLHDAAENGHFRVIDLLLKKGACASVLNDAGDTPLDCFQRWRERSDLSRDDEEVYKKLSRALRSDLNVEELKNLVPDSVKAKRTRALVSKREASRTTTEAEPSLRRNCDNFEDVEAGPSTSATEKLSSAAEEYRAAILGVRKGRSKRKEGAGERGGDRGPLVSEGDYVIDDWLVDDIDVEHEEQPQKKRRVATPPERDSAPASPILFRCRNPQRSCGPAEEIADADIDFGPMRLEEEAPEANESPPPVAEMPAEEEREPRSESPDASVVHLKLGILNQTFAIAVQKWKTEVLTVEWLAEEAAYRYKELNGRKPALVLLTAVGDIIPKWDTLSTVVNEDIEAKVVDWVSLTLAEVYREECFRMEDYRHESSRCNRSVSTRPDPHVMAAFELSASEGSLRLDDMGLFPCDSIPIFKTIESQRLKLRVLDLSRNALGDEGVVHLVRCFVTCAFHTVNLSGNNITGRGIKYLSDSLEKLPRDGAGARELRRLDLSFNPLKDASVDSLNKLIDALPDLESMITAWCDLTRPLKKYFHQGKYEGQSGRGAVPSGLDPTSSSAIVRDEALR